MDKSFHVEIDLGREERKEKKLREYGGCGGRVCGERGIAGPQPMNDLSRFG